MGLAFTGKMSHLILKCLLRTTVLSQSQHVLTEHLQKWALKLEFINMPRRGNNLSSWILNVCRNTSKSMFSASVCTCVFSPLLDGNPMHDDRTGDFDLLFYTGGVSNGWTLYGCLIGYLAQSSYDTVWSHLMTRQQHRDSILTHTHTLVPKEDNTTSKKKR